MLQKLLIRIPTLQNSTTTVHVSTQTGRDEGSVCGESSLKSPAELVVACHPVTVTPYNEDHNFINNSCFNESGVVTVKAEGVRKRQKTTEQSVNEKHENDFPYQVFVL